ncbi:hypothetical protein Tco_1241109 [Tanacetum coccineum]
MYVEYLKEFWYTIEVEEETKTITFSLSWWDEPLSFTQDEFISAIGLPICKEAAPLPPKETVRAGLASLGLSDKDKPTLSSTVLVNSSPLNMNNDLTLVKPHTITVASFRPMGRDRAKAKKKAAGSSREGASSFVDLVAKKFYNMKQKNRERRTQQSYIELKNQELSIPRG